MNIEKAMGTNLSYVLLVVHVPTILNRSMQTNGRPSTTKKDLTINVILYMYTIFQRTFAFDVSFTRS